MKFQIYIIIFLLLCSSAKLLSQEVKGLKPIKETASKQSSNVFAVVVGISDYQNENITDLQYAHTDAKIFADYLKSPKGLNVDSNRVIVLLNENATAGKFISALYGLIEESKKGDEVIIYFSGHGDVESTTISQPGFLLCWDAPAHVYMSGGTFGLAYLQEIISTLSLQSKAKVIVITDACRSGKLAGSSIGGAGATASNLSKQYANELKILSCQPDEFSLEGESWGHGRGVFSYFLMAGLKGLADKNNDNQVSLLEIERYLEDNVSKSVAPHVQIPMTVGQKSAILVQVNDESKRLAEEEMHNQELKFSSDKGIEDALVQEDSTVNKKFMAFKEAISKHHLLYPRNGSAWELYQSLKNESSLSRYHGLMRRNLAAALQDETQQVLNKYLASDEREIGKRLLYDSSYFYYPEALEKAASLLGEHHFYYKTLKARSYYFKGLIQRLKAQQTDEEADYLSALNFQDSCLMLDTTAAFSYNEKALIFDKLNKMHDALENYTKALAFSPNWALVWSNISSTYNDNGESQLALDYGLHALQLDSSFSMAYYNVGKALESMGKHQKAYTYFTDGLKIDSNNVFLNRKIGLANFEGKDYKKAEKYFLKALQLAPFGIHNSINLGHLYLATQDTAKAKYYFLKAKSEHPKRIEADQGIIEFYYYTADYMAAKSKLQDYLKVHDDGMAYLLLSGLEAKDGMLEAAILNLSKALENGMTDFETIENEPFLKDVIQTNEYSNLKTKYSNNPKH